MLVEVLYSNYSIHLIVDIVSVLVVVVVVVVVELRVYVRKMTMKSLYLVMLLNVVMDSIVDYSDAKVEKRNYLIQLKLLIYVHWKAMPMVKEIPKPMLMRSMLDKLITFVINVQVNVEELHHQL